MQARVGCVRGLNAGAHGTPWHAVSERVASGPVPAICYGPGVCTLNVITCAIGAEVERGAGEEKTKAQEGLGDTSWD